MVYIRIRPQHSDPLHKSKVGLQRLFGHGRLQLVKVSRNTRHENLHLLRAQGGQKPVYARGLYRSMTRKAINVINHLLSFK